MHQDNSLDHWLKQLGSEYGADFSFDDNGRCVLDADHNTRIYLYTEPTGTCLWINASVMTVPAQERDALLLKALSLNLYHQDTQGASVAFDEQANTFFLSLSDSVSKLTYQEFKNCINNLALSTKKVRDILNLSQIGSQQQSELPRLNPALMMA